MRLNDAVFGVLLLLFSGAMIAYTRTFPATRPILALDRVYARGADIVGLEAHASAAARKASDHLPVRAKVKLH